MRHLAATLFLAAAVAACENGPSNALQGYIEGEFALLASPYAGQLQKLAVRRGERVEAGAPVFALEQESERAARAEAESRLRAAQARLENLRTARRPPEIEALRADVRQARAALELSSAQVARAEKLLKEGFITRSGVDEARSAYERDRARLAQAEAQLANALQPLGRDAEREAAEREVAAAQAALEQAAWRVDQKSVAAPVAGLVQDTFFVEGEWVPAGRPVVSLLAPGNVKARFYVPEAMLGAVRFGQAVEIRCDGCPQPIAGHVSFIAPQAEYTPPVLYSRESRTKLRFLVEARPEPGTGLELHPGQPVDVILK